MINLYTGIFSIGDLYLSISNFCDVMAITNGFDREFDPEAHLRKGTTYLKLGNAGERPADTYREALKHFDKALKLSPLFAKAHIAKGYVLTNLRRYGEAISSFERGYRIEQDLRTPFKGLRYLFDDAVHRFELSDDRLVKLIELDAPQVVTDRERLIWKNRMLDLKKVYSALERNKCPADNYDSGLIEKIKNY